ncbi:MAG: hypothetical protein AABX37_00340 [Nanoarchaeota archaeon]
MTVFIDIKKEALRKLEKEGFKREAGKTIYEEARFTKERVILVLYTSGKLLVQGVEEDVKNISDHLERWGIGERGQEEHFRKETGWIIGSDESLKGDTFGGIVVAAVKADETIRQKLIELGVADSKTLEDKEIIPMAEKIKQIAPCEIRSILPEEYNRREGNVTILLDKLHGECAQYLQPGKHVVDKYPGCVVGDVIEEKAESKYVEVAAASVIARAAALGQMDFLSAEAGFAVPKGSTHVLWALQELKEKRLEFRKFVKIDFRNVKEFLK